MTAVAGRPIAGLLGRDFLSPFDLDLDLPAHRMTLYDVRGCDAGFLPWTTPYAAIPASTPMGAALVVQVLVDGRPLRALIDTGASASLITAPGMFRLGLTSELLARDPSGYGSGVDAVDRVAAGECVVDRAVVEELLARRRRDDPVVDLTPREREILGLMAEGRSNNGIGRALWLSPKTVETHIRGAFQKLGIKEAPEDNRRVLAVLTYLRR